MEINDLLEEINSTLLDINMTLAPIDDTLRYLENIAGDLQARLDEMEDAEEE